jgi:DNA end-binding protein Ku
MARYSSWKGYLKISLVSIPVKAYSASSGSSGKISLNQLHDKCNSRIQYKKSCPVHGEIPSEEIVSGYEYQKGQYVIIDTDELEKLRTESDRSVNINSFVKSDKLDPLYHSGKNYYLVPDGPVGQKAYQLIQEAMLNENVQAVGLVVISKKEEVVVIRPVERLLVMTPLNFTTEVKEPASFFDELVVSAGTAQESELTRQLITALTTDDFDLSTYHDRYTEKLTQLIEAKVEGKEIVAAPAGEEPKVINLMDAIRASMQQIKVPEKTAEKPERKAAPSKTTRATKTTATTDAAKTPPAATAKPASRKRKIG